jgi:hypothetical protein
MSEDTNLSLATVDEIAAELKRRSGNGYSFALFVQKLGGYPKIDQHWYFGSDAGPPGIAGRFLDGIQLALSDCDQSNCKRPDMASHLSWLLSVAKEQLFVMKEGPK